MSLTDVAYNVVHDYPGGVEALAPRVGKNATTFSHEVRKTGQAKLGLEDAEKVTHATRDLRILTAFALSCDHYIVPLPECGEGDEDTLQGIAAAAREFSEFIATAASSAADGNVTGNELKKVDREMGELVQRIQAVRAHLAHLHHLASPAAKSLDRGVR